ncbi:MAG: glycosyltransferase [Terriglobia bacterium]
MQNRLDNERRVVFLMTNSFETGGSERQFTVLADSLNRELFRVELGCIGQGGAFRKALGDIVVTSVPPGGNVYGLNSWRSRITLARRLRRRHTAIAHAFDFYSNLMLIPAARLARTPIVIGSHRQIGDLLTPMRLRAQVAMFRLCDRVICNSRAAAQALLEHGVAERKITIIHNGLPDEAFAEAPPALPRPPGVLRVGMVARMNDPVKNYPGLLHAAARVAPNFPELEFVLVGDGPLRPGLERMVRSLCLDRQVRFLGDRQDIRAVLSSLDISLLPSFSESLSNSLLESMAAGLPVIATAVGGNTELVRDGETGFLVPPNDEISLADALERLLKDPAMRAAFGMRARAIARANFSLARMKEQHEALYARLLADKGRKARAAVFAQPKRREAGAPIRVAIVAPTLRYVGGQAVEADLLLKHWANDPGVEARLIPVDPKLPGWIEWTMRIRYLRTVTRMPFYWVALWRNLKDVDIAHIFSASYWAFLLAPLPALALAHLRGKKTLINYHSGEARDHLSRWRTALPILRRADCLVVPSMYLAGVFREFDLNAEVAPNFIDLNQFRYRRRNPVRPRLICSRGFGAYYGLELVVRAFARVKQQFPDARLCLLGEGEQELQIRALVRELGLAGVQFAGAVSRQDVGGYYNDADIFINASWLDNMPLSILEAFASGIPVVTTAPEGIKCLVEHERTGLLSEPGDWQALAASVIRLLRDPNLALRMADGALAESRKYSWKAVRGQWLDIYRKLACDTVLTDQAARASRSRRPRAVSANGSGECVSPDAEFAAREKPSVDRA